LRLLTRDNRQPEALTIYKEFCQLLRTELDAEPLESTRALVDSLQQTTPRYSPPPEQRGHNLPVPTTSLVGRSNELDQLGELLANPACRLLTLLGIGGVGKTRLALECAKMQTNNFADGVWFIPLASVTSATLLAPAIANTLGITLSGSNHPDSELAAYLKPKELLLVLDNLEQLDYATPCLTQLLSEASQIKLLMTSRVALGTPGEWLFDVSGLS
jgi:hypothetical protein